MIEGDYVSKEWYEGVLEVTKKKSKLRFKNINLLF